MSCGCWGFNHGDWAEFEDTAQLAPSEYSAWARLRLGWAHQVERFGQSRVGNDPGGGRLQESRSVGLAAFGNGNGGVRWVVVSLRPPDGLMSVSMARGTSDILVTVFRDVTAGTWTISFTIRADGSRASTHVSTH